MNEIENDHIYMAPLNELNDPFDSSCAFSFEEACEDKNLPMYYYLSAFFLRQYPWHADLEAQICEMPADRITLKHFAQFVSSFAHKVGDTLSETTICKTYYNLCVRTISKRNTLGRVACFSETWESIPMWSYYANSHRGVCLKYDFNLLDTEQVTNRIIQGSLQKVWYSERRYSDTGGNFTPFVKSLQWAHEQEWRLFRNSEEKYLYIPCLSEIYLGINFDTDSLTDIIDAVKKNGRNIRIFLVQPKPDVYGFECIPVHCSIG